MTPIACTPEGRAALQSVMFPRGRAVVATFQREHRLGWNEAREILLVLKAGGWLDGLVLSPFIFGELP